MAIICSGNLWNLACNERSCGSTGYLLSEDPQAACADWFSAASNQIENVFKLFNIH